MGIISGMIFSFSGNRVVCGRPGFPFLWKKTAAQSHVQQSPYVWEVSFPISFFKDRADLVKVGSKGDILLPRRSRKPHGNHTNLKSDDWRSVPYHGVFLIKNGRKKFNLPVNYVVRLTDHFSDHRASYLNLHGSHADWQNAWSHPRSCLFLCYRSPGSP